MGESIRIVKHSSFNQIAFGDRWKAARLAAIFSVLDEDLPELEFDETALLSLVNESDRDALLKGVFDNSRKLGVSAARHFSLSWELDDLRDILGELAVPCTRGSWTKGNHSQVLTRAGCDEQTYIGPLYCDYWREAFDGLTMGVCENERYARHASVGHGDINCIDVFFDDSSGASSSGNKWGEVPGSISEGLAPLQTYFKEQKVILSLKGLSEGILYYLMEKENGVLCGSSAQQYNQLLAREVGNHFPGLSLQDASPLAVYGEGTK